MSLIRRDRKWGLDPFQEIARLEDEMRDIFTNVFGNRDLTNRERSFAPLVDIRETEKGYIIEADIPGFNKEDITIELTSESIELTAEKNEEKETKDDTKEGQYLRKERCAYKFYRMISLPSPIDTDKVESTYNKGTLKLNLTKAPGTEKKRIKLQ